MVDRYTRAVLTVIAVCLVYLCLVVSRAGTPLGAQAIPQAPPQAPPGAARPGLGTGPAEVVIVGWRSSESDPPVPVSVRNTVTTQNSTESVTRVVVTGWEDSRDPQRGPVGLTRDTGLPVDLGGRATKVVLVGTEPAPGAWRQRVPVEAGRDIPAPKR
jgi:hypothetical protein